MRLSVCKKGHHRGKRRFWQNTLIIAAISESDDVNVSRMAANCGAEECRSAQIPCTISEIGSRRLKKGH
jgi:hypothetical protein